MTARAGLTVVGQVAGQLHGVLLEPPARGERFAGGSTPAAAASAASALSR